MKQRRGVQGHSKQAVAIRMLVKNDGPMFDFLKRASGGVIQLPARINHRLERDQLARRFEWLKAPA